MKRILSFILVAILCLGVLTGCEQVGGILDNVTGTVGGWLGLGGNETVGPTVDNAVTVLHNIMKEKNPITRDDYDVVAQVVAASDDGTKGTFKVTWTVDDDAIVIRESTKTGFYTVDLPDANAEEFTYTLTATISDDAGNTASKSYTFTFPVINNTGITSEPVEGVAYKIFLLQGSFQQRYYALATTQNNENKFINTDLDPVKAADFFVEKVDGGYKFYTNVDGVKTYVYAKTTKDESTGKISKYIGFSTEEGSVFSYNEAKGGVWTVKIDGLVYGVGTYGTYTTISLSDESYFTPEKVGDSQFVIKFITSEYANTLGPDKAPEKEDDAKAILEKLYGLADGESASGSFTLTGKITALDSYNNPTIVVAGYENMPVYCYKLSDDRFEIGATITVTALSMKNYGGTYEFMSCTLDKFTAAGGSGSTEGGESYGVITELKTGDHVLIGNPSNGKLLSSTKTGFYNVGVDYSADNFANVTDAEIWVVTVNDDGSYSFTSLTGEKLGMAADYSSFNSEGPNFGWALEAKEGANGIFYIKNTVRGNYIEWYADKGNWSSYATSNLSDLFELSFYKKGASGSDTPGSNEDAKAILDALYALKDGESLTGSFTLTGKITALDNYSNPTIVVEGFENMPVYCYRLKVTNAVGDTITVTAKSMKNYGGTYEFMDCTLVENSDQGGEDGGEDGGETTDGPINSTIKEVLTVAGGFSDPNWQGAYSTVKYVVTGTIIEIANADKGNFYIADAEGNKIIVYGSYNADGSVGYAAMENKPVVGDVVTVVGVVGVYGTNPQLKDGWITNNVPHTHDYAAATCVLPQVCTICNGTTGEALGHSEGADGVCTTCGENLKATIVDETFNITANAGTLADDKLSITWNSDNFVFTGYKHNSSTAIRTSDSDHFRVYQSSKFEIKGNDGQKITKVVITVTESKYASIVVASLTSAGATATANGSTVTIELSGSLDVIEFVATAQFRIKTIVVSYK